jgi:hypothetical protein
MMNSDIQDELELTDDITFDKSIRVEFENRAARVIQRWYKELMRDRLMKEAEQAIAYTRQMMRLKKERLLKETNPVRDSMELIDES